MADSAQIKSVSQPWHEALAEYLILYPEKTLGETAKHFHVTLTWLCTVKNSDAFQDYYQARRRDHFGDVSRHLAQAKIEDKLETLAEMSIDGLSKKVEDHLTSPDPLKELSLDALRDTAQLALRSLGFGAQKVPSGSPVQNNIYIGDSSALDRARNNLRHIRERIIDPVISKEREERAEKQLGVPSDGPQLELRAITGSDKAAA